MALREEFERTGGWLFARRGYLPVIMLAPICAALLHYKYPEGRHDLDQLWEVFCLAIGLTGLLVRALTVGFTPAGTSGRNTAEQVAASLNVSGMYSLVRHPLYVGNYLMWLGPSFFPRVWWVPVLVTLAFWLYYERIMFAEEEFLRRAFGAAYEEWAARTPAFIPTHFRWVPPALPFSLRNVLRREYSGLFGLIATFVVLEMVSDFAATGELEWDRMWGWIFAASLIVYLVLRTLKRQTRILHVKGR